MMPLANHCLYVLINNLTGGRFHWAFYIPELIPTLTYTPTLPTLGSHPQYHHLTGMRKGDIYHVTNYLGTQPWTRELGVLLPKSSFDSDATLVLAVKIADFSSEGGLGRHSWNRRRFIQVLEKIPVEDGGITMTSGTGTLVGGNPNNTIGNGNDGGGGLGGSGGGGGGGGGSSTEPFACAKWSMEAVRRLSSWEVMGAEGPVLECPNPQSWMDEIHEWAKEASAQCAGVIGEVVIKESTECRVWKSKREERGATSSGSSGPATSASIVSMPITS